MSSNFARVYRDRERLNEEDDKRAEERLLREPAMRALIEERQERNKINDEQRKSVDDMRERLRDT